MLQSLLAIVLILCLPFLCSPKLGIRGRERAPGKAVFVQASMRNLASCCVWLMSGYDGTGRKEEGETRVSFLLMGGPRFTSFLCTESSRIPAIANL